MCVTGPLGWGLRPPIGAPHAGPRQPAPPSARAPRRPFRATLVGALAGASAVVALPAMTSTAEAAPNTEGSDLTVIQANLLSPAE